MHNYPKRFKHGSSFTGAKTCYHAMRKDDLFQDYKELADKTCNYANPQLDAGVLIACNRDIYSAIRDNYRQTIPRTVLNVLLMTVLRFAFPGKGSKADPDHDQLWILNTQGKVAQAAKFFKCPVAGAGVYLKAAKPATPMKARRTGGSKGRERATSGKLKRSSHASANLGSEKKRLKQEQQLLMSERLSESVAPLMDDEGVAADASDGSGDALLDADDKQDMPNFAVGHIDDPTANEPPIAEGRKLICDDVCAAFQGVLDHIPPEQHHALSIETFRRQVAFFNCKKHEYGPYQGVMQHSELQHALREKLALDHRGTTMAALNNLSAKVAHDIKQKEIEAKVLLKRLFSEKDLIDTFKAWVDENDLDMPLETLPCFTNSLRGCCRTASL